MAKKAPPAASADRKAKIQGEVETGSFEQLLKHFNESTCEADAFAVAAHMFTRFPNESKKLLPLIKDEQLGYDGKTDQPGTNLEWAAALAAAKTLKDNNNNIQLSGIEEPAINKNACAIYKEAVAKGAASCKAR